jgi:hypothetical protein
MPAGRWTATMPSQLTAAALGELFDNRIPAIHLPGFATPPECAAFVAEVDRLPPDYYENVSPRIGRLGISQFECGRRGKRRYFALANEARRALRRVSDATFDPVSRLADLLSRAGVCARVAVEAGRGKYFAGIVRRIEEGAQVHVDVSSIDAAGWAVGEVDAQVAWNLYLAAPRHGGECLVYDRAWRPRDEKRRIAETYGYDPRIVDRAACVRIAPRVGDLYLFNCRNYHQVLPADGGRMAIGSFLGRTRDGRFLLWS